MSIFSQYERSMASSSKLQDGTTDMELFKYLIQNRNDACGLPLCIETFLESKGLSVKGGIKAADSYKHATYFEILKVLSTLGVCAKNDFLKLKELRRQEQKHSPLLGITGQEITKQSLNTEYSEDYGAQTINFKKEDPLSQVCEHIDECRNKISDLEKTVQTLSENTDQLMAQYKTDKPAQSPCYQQKVEGQQQNILKDKQKLSEDSCLKAFQYSYSILQRTMSEWRWVQGLVHVKLRNMSKELLEVIFNKLHGLFCDFFNLNDIAVRELTKCCGIVENIDKIIAQVMSLRKLTAQILLGKEFCSKDFRVTGIIISPGGEKLMDMTFPKSVNKEPVENGTQISISEVRVTEKKRPQKRGAASSIEQFLRIEIHLEFSHKSDVMIKCQSQPFIIRTGSVQLWPCEGAITWCCYSKEIGTKGDLKYLEQLSIKELLWMLYLSLTTQNQWTFANKEIIALTEKLKSLNKKTTHTDEITMKQFVKDPMSPTGKKPYSTFAWWRAALNTFQFLMTISEELRKCPVFMSPRQCKLMKLEDGNACIRISSNSISSPQGQKPYAHVVVHCFKNKEMLTYHRAVETIENVSFKSYLESFVNEGEGLVKQVFPNISLSQLNTPESSAERGNINHYKTLIKEDLPKINLSLPSEMEALSLHSASQESLCQEEYPYDGVLRKVPRVTQSSSETVAAERQTFNDTADISDFNLSQDVVDYITSQVSQEDMDLGLQVIDAANNLGQN